MSQDPTANGASASEPRQRPSWYVPIEPVPEDDHRSVQQVLRETWGDDPVELPPQAAEELLAYLDQYKVAPHR